MILFHSAASLQSHSSSQHDLSPPCQAFPPVPLANRRRVRRSGAAQSTLKTDYKEDLTIAEAQALAVKVMAKSLDSATLTSVRPPHNMDYPPTGWPQSPRIVVKCDPWESNGLSPRIVRPSGEARVLGRLPQRSAPSPRPHRQARPPSRTAFSAAAAAAAAAAEATTGSCLEASHQRTGGKGTVGQEEGRRGERLPGSTQCTSPLPRNAPKNALEQLAYYRKAHAPLTTCVRVACRRFGGLQGALGGGGRRSDLGARPPQPHGLQPVTMAPITSDCDTMRCPRIKWP